MLLQHLFIVLLLLLGTSAVEIKRLDMDDFHHLGNFLRSMQKQESLDHLYRPFQEYIVQRTVRGAKGDVNENDDEETLFFRIFADFGQTNLLGADWSADDLVLVKSLCTTLVKKMNRRRRLEDLEEEEVQIGL